MNRSLQKRLASVEAKRRASDLDRMSDDEIEARIADLDAILFKGLVPDEIRAEMHAFGCTDEVLSFLPSLRAPEPHTPH